jgi:hypothetical protein
VTLRGLDWVVILAGSTLGAVMLGGCVALAAPGPPFWFLRLSLITLGAAAAFVLDEPAAATVDAVPLTRRRRTAVRCAAVVLPFGIWVGGVLALEQRNSVTQVAALLVEGAGVLAVAVALAAVLRLAGRNEPGEIVATVLGAALLLVLIINPPPRSAPLFPMYEGWAASTALWSCVMVGAVALVNVASRDPIRRH